MKKIKHHTVPECYLKNFTDKSGKNWVFDLRSRKIITANPKDVLTDKHFYTVRFPTGGGTLSVENTLAAIEGAFIEIYRSKIAKKQPLEPKERATVAVFLGAMLFRTRSSRYSISCFVNDVKRVVDELNAMSLEEKKQAAALHIPSGNRGSSANEFLEETSDVGSFHSRMLVAVLPKISNYMFKMRWCILYPHDSLLNYFTSDNPCALVNPILIKHYGHEAIYGAARLEQKDVELVFPLSSSYCLLAGWRLNNEIYIDVDEQMVNTMNHRIMTCTHETLVGCDKKQLEEASKLFGAK